LKSGGKPPHSKGGNSQSLVCGFCPRRAGNHSALQGVGNPCLTTPAALRARRAEKNSVRLFPGQMPTICEKRTKCLANLHETCLGDDTVKNREKTDEAARPSGKRARSLPIPTILQIVVECRSEQEQQAVFERLKGEGYSCRVLTL
jgi:hypothetical protein